MLTRLDDAEINEALPLTDRWVTFSDTLERGRMLGDIPWCIGVYAIYVGRHLVYVGMSTVSVGARLAVHFKRDPMRRPGILWSCHLQEFVRRSQVTIKIRCCRPDAATRREESLVSRLRPIGNKVVFHRGRERGRCA